MRRITYNVAVSLDGFICDSDRDVSAFGVIYAEYAVET